MAFDVGAPAHYGAIPAQYLPDSFDGCTSCEELDVSQNECRQLPERIGKLTRLRKLQLYGNKLGSLPRSLSQMASLRDMDLRGNQFSDKMLAPTYSRKGFDAELDRISGALDDSIALNPYKKSQYERRRRKAAFDAAYKNAIDGRGCPLYALTRLSRLDIRKNKLGGKNILHQLKYLGSWISESGSNTKEVNARLEASWN